MKVLISLIVALAMALGRLFAQSPPPPVSWPQLTQSQQISEASGLTEDIQVIALPQILNHQTVSQSLKMAFAAECVPLQGKVAYEVLVDQRGNYVTHRSPSFDEVPMIDHPLKDLRFEPATLEGEAIAAWISVNFWY